MQMLIDPAEDLFDLPARSVQLGDGKGWQQKIVGEQDESQILFGVEVVNAPQRIGTQARIFRAGELNGFVRPQSGRTQYRAQLASPELRVLFGKCVEEGGALREPVEAAKVQVPAVEQIKSTSFRQ